MKKYIGLLIILFVILGFYFYRHPVGKKTVSSLPLTEEQQLKLPEGWSKIENSKSDLKLEKKVSQGLKPQIAYKEITSKETGTPAKYVDTLIAGAKSAIPSLTIVTDKRTSEEKKYTAVLSGYYFNQKEKVTIVQRIYISGETVSVITASYTGDLTKEVNSIFDAIASLKIK